MKASIVILIVGVGQSVVAVASGDAAVVTEVVKAVDAVVDSVVGAVGGVVAAVVVDTVGGDVMVVRISVLVLRAVAEEVVDGVVVGFGVSNVVVVEGTVIVLVMFGRV